MLRIGLLGCGRIGQVHAKSLMRLETAQLVAVADAFPEAAQYVADSCGAIVMNVDDIISSDKIDAVIICTPTDTHFNMICDSANAGKAIFVKSRLICPLSVSVIVWWWFNPIMLHF